MAKFNPDTAKLSKKEIIDILERNVELYQKEANFMAYLVELAIHLVHYQYDAKKDLSEASSGAEPELEARQGLPKKSEKVITDMQSAFSVKKRKSVCPFCGTKVDKGVRCPTCGLQSG